MHVLLEVLGVGCVEEPLHCSWGALQIFSLEHHMQPTPWHVLIVLYGLGSKLHAPPPEGEGDGAADTSKVLEDDVEVPLTFLALQINSYIPASTRLTAVDGIVQLVAPLAAPPEP